MMHISSKYPYSIRTAHEVQVIGFEPILAIEIKKILECSNLRTIMQYDTTFNMTEYYVSSLNMLHPLLLKHNTKSSPPIPIGQFYHELKTKDTHEEFWRTVKKIFPTFEKKSVVLTDCEDAIRSSIKDVFPTIPLLRCWNHFFKAVERWILAHGGTIEDVGWYMESLCELQPTKESLFKTTINWGYLQIFCIVAELV